VSSDKPKGQFIVQQTVYQEYETILVTVRSDPLGGRPEPG
jgi:hypothetical protein